MKPSFVHMRHLWGGANTGLMHTQHRYANMIAACLIACPLQVLPLAAGACLQMKRRMVDVMLSLLKR